MFSCLNKEEKVYSFVYAMVEVKLNIQRDTERQDNEESRNIYFLPSS